MTRRSTKISSISWAKWTPIVFIFVLGLSFILLIIFFRSIVVPTKAILMNLLSVGAAYGLLVLVFQKGYLQNVLRVRARPRQSRPGSPFSSSASSSASAMDYQIFLLSRIREHYDQTRRNQERVAVGLQSTARIITGAARSWLRSSRVRRGALVMLQQVGFGSAVAVFIDARRPLDLGARLDGAAR